MGIQRQMFICSHIVFCKETANCCAHKQPHIKDERCIPKVCRFNPQTEEVDCVPVGKELKAEPEPEQIIIKAPAEIEPVKEGEFFTPTEEPDASEG